MSVCRCVCVSPPSKTDLHGILEDLRGSLGYIYIYIYIFIRGGLDELRPSFEDLRGGLEYLSGGPQYLSGGLEDLKKKRRQKTNNER